MKPFSERNHTIIGFVGFAVLILLLVGAFRADRLPIIGGGDTYRAEFAEVGNLRPGDEVRIAGIRVGKVAEIELDGNKAVVTFRITDGADFGETTGAAIRIRTLLGASFLALRPDGPGQLDEGATIPLSRTEPAYDVVQAFSDLSTTADALDVDQISTALETLAEVAAATPEEFGEAIAGLSEVSANLAARDEQINGLLTSLEQVTGVLNARNAELEALFTDSSSLFDAVSSRREEIHRLLVATQGISVELTTLVDQTSTDLQPALAELQDVTDTLVRNEASLDELLRVAPSFLRLFSEALGSGPWFDNFLGLGVGLPRTTAGGGA